MATVNEIVALLRLKGGEAFVREVRGKATQIKDSFASINKALAGAGAFLFLRDINEQANLATSAMLGLQSVAKFKNIDGAQAAVNDLEAVRAGMMSNFEAAAALKNLLSRGYNLEQAVAALNQLSNAAAFNRASHLSLGQAVVTATEGLKNENSLLVDNAGVTKNVSVIWKEYAEQIGKGVQSLTMQEKIQAEVNGLSRETAAQMGDLAKLANTEAGAQARLAAERTKASAALGKSFQILSGPFFSLIGQMLESFNRAPQIFQNFTVAMGAMTTAVYFFGSALKILLPMIGPAGWVLIALSTVAGLFLALETQTLASSQAIDEFRSSLAALSLTEAEKKLDSLQQKLREFRLEFRATNTNLGGTTIAVNQQEKDLLQAQIDELQKYIAEKKKLANDAAAIATPAALSEKEAEAAKERLDNQRAYEFKHFQIGRAQYLEYLRQRQNDFTQWSGEWVDLQEEIAKQENQLALEQFVNSRSLQERALGELRQSEENKRDIMRATTQIVKHHFQEESQEYEQAAARQAAALEQFAEFQSRMRDQAAFMAAALSAITQSITTAAIQGKNAFKEFWKGMLVAALDAIERYFIAAKIKTILDTVINPFAALKDIAPLAVASGLLAALKGQIAALADGALITGPTLALVGESLGPGNRFEVAAPERDFNAYSDELIQSALARANVKSDTGGGRAVNVTLNFNTALTDKRQAQRISDEVLVPEVRRETRRKSRFENETVVNE